MALCTVKELIGHLENVAKDGKGDLPVYIVHPESDTARPLLQGDTMRVNGQPVRFLLIPEAIQHMSLPNLTTPH